MTIIRSHWKPWETQTEKIVAWPLFQQWFVFWIWTVLWYAFSFVGNDPINDVSPPIVNNESAKLVDQQAFG